MIRSGNADAPAKLGSGESARAVVLEQHRDLSLVLLVFGFHPAMSTVARMARKMGCSDVYVDDLRPAVFDNGHGLTLLRPWAISIPYFLKTPLVRGVAQVHRTGQPRSW